MLRKAGEAVAEKKETRGTAKQEKQELLEVLSVAAGLSFFLLGQNGRVLEERRQSGEPGITEKSGYFSRLLENCQEAAAIVTDNEVCRLAYAVLSLEKAGVRAVFGPCVLGTLSSSERHVLCAQYQVSPEALWIPQRSYVELANLLEVGVYVLHGQRMDIRQMFQTAVPEEAQADIRKAEICYHWEQTEEGWEHLPFKEEQRVFQVVSEGNTEALRGMDIQLLEGVGRMARGRWKQIEYMVVSSVTLATRAAISGGVPPATAYNLSDLYLQRLEACREPGEMLRIHSEMMRQFTKRVKELQETRGKKGGYVEACKTILQEHIQKPVTMAEVARQLSLNPCYLSRIFKKAEGKGMREYLEEERLKRAAELLGASDASYAQIADSLCYASQSRFGERFKRQYGKTPAQYRRDVRF